MEEHTEETTTPTPGQVMDIQPSKSVPVIEAPSEETTETAEEASTAPQVSVNSEGTLAEVGTEDTEEAVNSPEPESVGSQESETTTEAASFSPPAASMPASEPIDNPVEHHEPTEPHTPPAKKHGAPMFAIGLAVVIALVLAGLVVYSYTKNKHTTDTTKTNSQPIVPKPQASVNDIDNTNKELDASLQKANDATDFNTSDLSDQSLGL